MAQQQAAAVRERDLALAMHETFLSSGSEDALSPRFQKLEIRSPTGSLSPRTPRSTARPPSSSLGSPKPSQFSQQLGQTKVDELEKSESQLEALFLSLRETEFDIHEKGVARINNGSFGTCPKSVLLRQEEWVQKWLEQPDAMYFGPLERGLLEARKLVAAHVNCPVEELVLIDNVTVGANVVALDIMWSFIEGRFQKGDAILLSNFTYGAVGIAFEAYAARAGAKILIAEIPFPVGSFEEILLSYEKILQLAQKKGEVIRMAILDHVVSMPSMIVPLKEVITMCRHYGVEEVFVDGAQALGNVEVDLKEIDADFYAGNLHKWFFAPTTAAFFHCKPKHLPRMHHPVVSHNYGKGLDKECEWMGTRDFSAMLVVPAAFEFLNKIPGGPAAMRAYNHKKVLTAGKMLAEAWGTYCGVAPELCAAMVMVGLPPALGIQETAETEALRTRLRREFSIEVHVYTPPREQAGKSPVEGVIAHVRVSHQIYNTWDEYLRLRDAINALVVERSKQQNR